MRSFWRNAGGMAVLAVLAAIAACAGTPQAAAPAEMHALSLAEPQGSYHFTPDGIEALEARLAAYVEEGRVMGIAARLVKDGDVVSDMRAGIRRAGDGAPVAQDTIWRLYSMTKPVTGVAMLILWEEGRFELDDPVTKYFPEFEALQVFTGVDEAGLAMLVPVERPPTVQELMSHTAGFGYGLAPANYVDDQFRAANILAAPDAGEMIRRVAAIPLKRQPGELWDYSISVDIQGAMIERLSGLSLGEFFRTRIFEPLGMNDTGFYVPHETYERFSDLWGRHPETGALTGPLDAPAFLYRKDTIAFEGGGHGLVGTLDDYARFAMMLANGGSLEGVEILKPETAEMMASNFLPDGRSIWHNGTSQDTINSLAFGLNVGLVTAEDAVFPKGSFMWGGAAGTWFWVDPASRLAFVGMIQVFGGALDRDMRAESAQLVYGAMRGSR
jgi:CubicO group peptidase (beta-lactamase class C family)